MCGYMPRSATQSTQKGGDRSMEIKSTTHTLSGVLLNISIRATHHMEEIGKKVKCHILEVIFHSTQCHALNLLRRLRHYRIDAVSTQRTTP